MDMIVRCNGTKVARVTALCVEISHQPDGVPLGIAALATPASCSAANCPRWPMELPRQGTPALLQLAYVAPGRLVRQ
jgi:hypothetical protein